MLTKRGIKKFTQRDAENIFELIPEAKPTKREKEIIRKRKDEVVSLEDLKKKLG